MASFGFYLAGVGAAAIGRLGLLLAWDPADRGPSAVDDLDMSGIALYSWAGPLPVVTPQVLKLKSAGPIAIPTDGLPAELDDPAHDYVLRFGVKASGTGASLVVDGWLEVFEGSTRVYGAVPAGSTMKIDLAEGSYAVATEASMQDRVVLQALEDPPEGDVYTAMVGNGVDSKEIWRELMTPGLPLVWSPV
jgi:hypothetical protein